MYIHECAYELNVCLYVRMNVHIHVFICVYVGPMHVCLYVYVYVYASCMHVCMHNACIAYIMYLYT